ncbi:hypothetical protein VOLCADRAFT_102936 [Volvox carteri f. nagariensis]|uniref:CAAX prenyl protease 2/Lysostaphin resistance protein A-like domain-containing protein n=1 Tax=Volvox carteri f. nagariensis TaxID=3068 RepID=D8TIW2_VOLCA|nr:uncharacterized protein VOLCADRAFT_102936 [Volvox carteri f. nagariensis]EFJ52267.1 hypothetical protein VOLCADRAFT_102936 [Volvox carteri f. nagariensis]|eukprot:XP_002946340.1 hypothetical protein VOLCADRAFT_102936 [Volvox carteri f. nagariensis]
MGTSLLPLGWRCQTCEGCSCRRGSRLVAYARKQAKRNNRQQTNQPADRPDTTKPRIAIEALEQDLPQAPSPSSRPRRQQEALSPGEIYPVFAPKPGSLVASDAPWRWDDEDEDRRGAQADDATTSGTSDVPRWNPRTGFMRTASEVQAEAAAAAGAAGANSTAGTQAEPAAPALAAALKPDPSSQPPLLPAVSRNAVLSSALGTGFWMAILAVFVRNYASLNSAATMGTDPAAVEALLRWPAGLESLTDVAVAAGAAAAVTGARLALLAVWSDLREATDRSNQQVLTPLGSFDILLVAAASGIPEELLFRGALLPATFPDWRGLLLSAALFGVLHNTGGRNPAFAAWAAAVGALYGGAFLVTGNVWVPALAHAAANAASAFIWKANRAK